jgi:hypothetical protein
MEVSGQLQPPAAFPPRERVPDDHWIGGWVGPRAGLDAVVKRKIPTSRQESNPRLTCIRGNPPYLKAVSCIRILTTCHAVVTRETSNTYFFLRKLQN